MPDVQTVAVRHLRVTRERQLAAQRDLKTAINKLLCIWQADYRRVSDEHFSIMYHMSERKTLGELCVFPHSSGLDPKAGNPVGAYPFYCNSIVKYLDTYDTDSTEIILNKTGKTDEYTVYLADGKYTVAKNTIRLKHPSRRMTKFIYYYLMSDKELFRYVYAGVNQKRINMAAFKAIQVPLACKEDQSEIIREFRMIDKHVATYKQRLVDINAQIRELESLLR